ncbi:tyrosine-type recombinase/integrase [Desulfopila aestuarii]|uniref:Integrase n=1 Tax=Desulfopila aestuarii DSM 18488 TaxID=1121416 RepID=A0A1M7YCV4_9BACT|nr:integrase arm-type DNA-binding domain-containing protein [Desulfopila aestuarii]SHO50421.1 Integrase [Desulfopila aestuarii DSM 18488]
MGRLTVQEVNNVKPSTIPRKLTDGGGLYLYVNGTGKYWRFDYRYLNKRKTLSLGVYPEITLKMARERHWEARKRLAEGVDPGYERKIEKIGRLRAQENSFSKLAWEWFGRQHWTEGHARTVRSRLENNVIPWLGDRPVNEITPREILLVCRRIENRGAYETAHRMKSICSQVFRYCVALGLCESDPCRDLQNALIPSVSKNMATITDPKQVGGLMRAIDGYQGNNVTKFGLQLAPLVFVRPGELRHAEWSEIDYTQSMWKIPAEKMKMRQTHLVPLSQQVIQIIRDLEPLTGRGKYLFPSIRSISRPMSDNTLLSALRRLGYLNNEMTVHGFRGMASTLLHEAGWDSKVIERQLAHTDRNSVRAAYNHAEYLPERRRMMQDWANYLDQLKGDW